MEELDKKQLDEIAQQKEYLIRREELLDLKINAIQKSTKTNIKRLQPLHEKLRAKWRWYYKWHLSPWSNILHYFVLITVLTGFSFSAFTQMGSFFSIQRARAAAFTSVADGAWSDQCTWIVTCDSGTPGASDSVTINHAVTVSADVSVGGITVSDTKTLSINTGITITASGAVDLGISGTVSGAGTLTLPDGAGALLDLDGTLSSKVRFDTVTADVAIPARTYGGVVEVYNNTATNYNATLGTTSGQTITFSNNFNPITDSTGQILLKADTYNPSINVVGSYTTTKNSTGVITTNMGSGTWTVSGSWNTCQGNAGIVNKGTSTLILNGSNQSISVANGSSVFYNLTISGTINPKNDYSGTPYVAHQFTVTSGAVLTLGSSAGTLVENGGTVSLGDFSTITGTGILILQGSSGSSLGTNGTISSTVKFDSNGIDGGVAARDYYGPVILSDCAYSNRTLTLGTAISQTINFHSDVTIKTWCGGTATLAVTAATYNPNINILGNLTVSQLAGTTITTNMGSSTWTVYGNVDLTGSTITPGTSIMNMAKMSGIQTLNTGNTSLGSVVHIGSGTLQAVTNNAGMANFTAPVTYSKIKTIIIDHTKVGEALTDFPMLYSVTDVNLKTVVNGGSVTNANGYDIIFTDSNGAKLDHELEKYDATTGELTAWIKIPSLSNTVDTTLNLLYGNSTISTSQENKTGVWSNGYAAVWHMNEGSGNINDSTAGVNYGTTTNVTYGASGKIGSATSYNRTGRINITTSPVIAGTFTYEGWTKPTNPENDTLVFVGSRSPETHGFNLKYNWAKIQGDLGNGTSWISGFGQTTGFSPVSGTWYHVVLVVTPTTWQYYVDGVPKGNGSLSGSSIPIFSDSQHLIAIGAGGQEGGDPFVGSIDDSRISPVARSAGWISTEYANQNIPSAFYSTGAEAATTPTIDANGLSFNVGGNFVGNSQQTFSSTGTLAMISTTTGHTIAANGMTIPNISFSGTNGRWSFSDNTTILGSLTINSGAILDGGTRTITVGDNTGTDDWINNGTFNYDTSTVNLIGTGNISRTAFKDHAFFNLTAAAAGKTTTASLYSTISVYGTCTFGSGTFNAPTSTDKLLAFSSGGTPFVTAGATLTGKIGYGSSNTTNIAATTYDILLIQASNGAINTAAGNITANSIILRHGTGVSGSFDTNGHDLTVTGDLDIGQDSYNRKNTFKPSAGGNINVGGNVNINLDTATGNNAIDLSSFTGTFNVAGNFTNNDTFTAGNSTVNFTGVNQTITGSTTFYNFSKTDTTNDSTDKTLTFATGSTTTISNNLTLTGLDDNDRVNLVSSSPGTTYNLAGLSGAKTISWVDVKDSIASAEIVASESKDSGNNTNWNLVKTLTFSVTPLTGTVNSPLAAAITAKDGTGAATNAIGDGIILSADSGTITPSTVTQANMTGGSWTSNIALDAVGDRTVTATLTGLTPLTDTIIISPDVLDHFVISGVPASVTVQSSFTNPIIVTAYDAWGNIKIDYVGQIYFTSTDGAATLPYTSGSKYIFTGLDAGYHSFPGSGFKLNSTGTYTISVTDSVAAITEESSSITSNPAALGSFIISGYPVSTVAGDAFATPANDITVTAKDIYGNVKTDYTGDLWFTTTDASGSVVLPYTSGSHYTFVGGDSGVRMFAGSGFTLITANGTKTISATNGSVAVTSSPITINPATLHHFTLGDYPQASANQFATAGYDWSTTGTGGGSNAPYDIVVTAYDNFGNVKQDFAGTVWFTIENGITSAFPYDSAENSYTFSTNGGSVRTTKADSSDNGRHIFDANTFTISTADPSADFTVNTSGISSTFQIKIKPASIASVTVTLNPTFSNKLVDTQLTENVIITAYDSAGNVKTDYEGDIYFTSSDTSAALPYTEQNKCTFSLLDGGTKTFTSANTPTNYFNFHTGGNHTLSVVAEADVDTIVGNSSTFTISAHTSTSVQATAGHTQAILDWLNPTDPAVSNMNIYQSDTEGVLGSKIASPSVNAGTYSQYIVTGLNNGQTYYFTLKAVVKTPQQIEVESIASDQVSAMPADIAARNISAIQLADDRVKVDYDLRYDSTVSIQYYNPDTSTWASASTGAQTGDVGAGQTGTEGLTSHTAYWTAKTDFNTKYYSSSQGFKIRVKVVVPSQGDSQATSPSPSFQLDTKDPFSTSLTVDASGDSTANLTIAASENGSNTITMMIANEPTFAGKTYQAYATSITNWNLEDKSVVYIRFKDPYSNTTTIHTDLVPVVDNFMIKDNSDLRTPAYQLVVSWADSTIDNFDRYIIERQVDNGAFSELVRTNQPAHLDIKLSKENLYGYRVKVLDQNGNISRPTAVLSSKPGLAPDVTGTPSVEVFGYKQDVGVRVTVKWNTDQLSDSFVAFSTETLDAGQNTLTTSGQNANIIGQLDRSSTHEVTITNLLPGKKYSMKALSQNDQKITGYSNIFEVNTPEYLPLQIKSLEFTDIRPDSVWINWQTNKVSTTELFYGLGSSFDKVLNDDTLNTDHKFKVENLTPGQDYKLKVVAADEDGNVVNSDEYELTPPAEPIVSGVSVSDILNNQATVKWTTNVNTDSNVEYGLDTSYGAQSGKSDMTTQHSVTLLGLEGKTTYHIKVKSKDVYGKEAVAGDMAFTTTADNDPPKLVEVQSQLSQVDSPQGPKYQTVISWKTDEGSTSQVEFGDNAAGKYSKSTAEDPSLNMTHVVILSDLKPNSAYSYRVVSKDKSGNEARSQNYTIITPPQEKSLVQVVISSLSETFSWVGKLRSKWFGN
ncbi:MAG: DUF2341 domain-containing protein [Patescibacteria group bacterium]